MEQKFFDVRAYHDFVYRGEQPTVESVGQLVNHLRVAKRRVAASAAVLEDIERLMERADVDMDGLVCGYSGLAYFLVQHREEHLADKQLIFMAGHLERDLLAWYDKVQRDGVPPRRPSVRLWHCPKCQVTAPERCACLRSASLADESRVKDTPAKPVTLPPVDAVRPAAVRPPSRMPSFVLPWKPMQEKRCDGCHKPLVYCACLSK